MIIDKWIFKFNSMETFSMYTWYSGGLQRNSFLGLCATWNEYIYEWYLLQTSRYELKKYADIDG